MIGAGPAGLAVTASLAKRGVRAHLVDRHGQPGGAYARMYPELCLASHPRFLSLPDFPIRSPGDSVTAHDYAKYLKAFSRHHALEVQKREVESVIKHNENFEVRFADAPQSLNYEALVVATGMYDHPVIPRVGNLPIEDAVGRAGPLVVYANNWQGPNQLRGSHVLIIGSGLSAVEIAEQCARSGLHVSLSARHGEMRWMFPSRVLGFHLNRVKGWFYGLLTLLPVRTVRALCVEGWPYPVRDEGFSGFLSAGLITIHAEVVSIQERDIGFSDGTRIAADSIVVAAGYRFDAPFLKDLFPDTDPAMLPILHSESRTIRNLFFLGMPCSRRADSHFVHGMAKDASRLGRIISSRLRS